MDASVPRSGRARGARRRPLAPVKPWGALPGDDPERDRAETEAAIAAAGIDLDPVPPGHHRHADGDVHPDGHSHPHQRIRAG